MRYAIIRDGIIENLTEWDGDEKTWQPPEGTEAKPLYEGVVSPGWQWNDGNPVDPNPPLPPPPPPEQTQKEKIEAVMGMSIAEMNVVFDAEKSGG